MADADRACEVLVSAINSAEGYREAKFNSESRIAGCELGPQEDDPDIFVGRLNADCRQDICGSVLMGWYAVDMRTGQAWEWDINEDIRGAEVMPAM